MARQTIQNANASLVSGTSSNVALAQTAGLPLYNNIAYSVFARFKVPTFKSGDNVIWSEGNSGTATQFVLIDCGSTGAGGLRVRMANDAGTVFVSNLLSTTKLNTGQWYDILWVDVAGVCKLYINGVADATNFNYTPTGVVTLNRSTIGALGRVVYANGLFGLLSDVQLYNYGITPSQVQLVRNGSLKGNVGNYPLNEGGGTVAYDTSGNGNNGTITSGTWSRETPTKTRKLVNNNLVYNGDFEIAPVVNVATTAGDKWIDGTASGAAATADPVFGWYVWNYTTSYAAMFDTSVKHSGTASMKLSTTATASTVGLKVSVNNSQGFKKNNIPVLPSTSYTYSVWIKTQANSGSATTGTRFQLVTTTGVSDVLTTTVVTGLVATQDWTQYTGTVTTGATARYITPLLQIVGNDGAGTLIMDAWFDDIQLYPTTAITRSAATGRLTATGRSAA